MLRIAVCDDEARCLRDISDMVLRWGAGRNAACQVLCFLNGEDLLEENRRKPFGIVLLDVIMPLLNGMELARLLRARDGNVKIVFLTTSPEFALESYSVKASGYLLKPVSREGLAGVLDELADGLLTEPENIVLKSECGYSKIYLRDIEYIEAQNKRILFFLRPGRSVEITQPLHSFEGRLTAADGFFKCHRSYIVSMRYVESFSSGEVIMKSGCRIPIARGAGKEFHEAYFSFMFRE